MKQQPKFIISGGGTGGHIFPALAIAQGLKHQYPDAQFLFVGALGKMEMEKVPAAGFQIVGLPITGFQRKLTWSNVLFPFRLLLSLLKSWSIIRSFRPDAVIGVGGFASGPLLEVAARRGIPTLIHEGNSFPGITNRLLGSKVNTICVAFDGMERFFPANKLVLTGNPVRADIRNSRNAKAEACTFFGLNILQPVLLVLGGSLGARTINLSMEAGLAELKKAGIQIIWQTGKSYAGGVVVENGLRTTFIERMDLAYAAADLVISRAGAMSISELCLVGKPVILVPSPNVAEDHQTKNALNLVNKGAAVLVKDADASKVLVHKVLELMWNEQWRRDAIDAIGKLARPRASEDIVLEVKKLLVHE